MHKAARTLHKWLMLFLGLQFVIWSITGTYMVFMHIDYIHGDSLISNPQTKINPDKLQYSLAKLLQTYPEAEQISVGKLMQQDVYRFSIPAINTTIITTQQVILNAQTGERHVMDYGDAEEIDNQLLFWIALFSTLATVSGLILVYFRVLRRTKNKRKPMLSKRKHSGVA